MQFTDQTGNAFHLPSRPVRIVSLVPSITELLFDLGLENEVVGITRFCVHPSSWYRSKTRIGGTKDPNIDLIKSLQPDLIIANKEENNARDVFALREQFPVWVSDVNHLESALEMVLSLGKLTGKEENAVALTAEIQTRFNTLARTIQDHDAPAKRVLYFIWKDPWMVAGSDTFINDMIRKCGWTNAEQRTRYPKYDLNEGTIQYVDLVLLSSEPYPFKEQHRQALQSKFPGASIHLVDGEFFSWYGSRLRFAPDYFREILNVI